MSRKKRKEEKKRKDKVDHLFLKYHSLFV